jgi:hypothetical protein
MTHDHDIHARRLAWSERSAVRTARCWAPLLLGFACLFVVSSFGPLVAWLLLILSAVLIFDGATAMFERAGSTGTLKDHRQ